MRTLNFASQDRISVAAHQIEICLHLDLTASLKLKY
jgi:hypothetical protein